MLDAWLLERETGRVPACRAPWERAGWLPFAVHWIRAQLRRLDVRVTGPIEPVKMAWSGSAVLRIPTSTGRLYFKAGAAKPPGEVEAIGTVAAHNPRNVPRILASDTGRRWMLMADFGPKLLESMPAEHWAAAVRRFAELQVECSADLDRWKRLGCPDRTGPHMAELWSRMLADLAEQGSDAAGLNERETDSLRAMGPAVDTLWRALDATGLPASIHLEDFRAVNVAVAEDGYVFFDWADCVAGHPFFSIQRLLDFVPAPDGVARRDGRMDHRQDGMRRLARDTYLEPWSAYASPAELREAFVLTRQLNDAYQAVRWYLEAGRTEAGTPWHALLVRDHLHHLRAVLAVPGDVGPGRPAR